MRSIVLAAAFACLFFSSAAQASFVVLPKVSVTDNATRGVSLDGKAVVGSRGFLASLWIDGVGFVTLPDRGNESTALGANQDGSVVVGRRLDDSSIYYQAVRWTQSNSIVLGRGLARDVTPDGAVIVGRQDFGFLFNSTESQPFRWTESSGMVGLGYLPGPTETLGGAVAVSADGAVIAGYSSSANTFSFNTEAFLWTQAGGMIGLGDLPGGNFNSTAIDMSADGSIVVGNGTTGAVGNNEAQQGFRWTQSTGMVAMGAGSRVDAISADGSTMVGHGLTALNVSEAVLWNSVGAMHSIKALLQAQGIDMTGWVLNEATGVSADGRVIVGSARKNSEPFVNFIAIIPEPAGALLALQLVTIACGMSRFRGRMRSLQV